MKYTVFGIPKPTVKCMKDDKELVPSDEVSIDIKDHDLSLIIKKAMRTETGKYVVSLHNESGTAEASVDILIYGECST